MPLKIFFSRRWRGQVPCGALFWRDMVLVGGSVNLLFGFLALALMAVGAPLAVVVAAHFAPLPYNLFLFAALWRLPGRPLWLSAAAIGWLLLATLI